MPELPEVETLRRSLEPALTGSRIVEVHVLRRDVIVTPADPPGGFSRQRAARKPAPLTPDALLHGATIAALHRRGKELALIARDGRSLRVRLGMTGQVRVRAHTADSNAGKPSSPHEHVRWALQAPDGQVLHLSFIDPRRFGGVWTHPTHAALLEAWNALGPDARTISADALAPRLSGARRPIKAALLDQSVLAGVGNIYADESLFLARIAPRRLASRLDSREVEDLSRAIRATLERAIQARGSTLRDFADAAGNAGYAQLAHAVYGRAGQACHQCDGPLRSASIAQRTTVWCPTCQRSRHSPAAHR